MTKFARHIVSLLSIIGLFINSLQAQSIKDTSLVLPTDSINLTSNDTIPLNDSLRVDSLRVDSLMTDSTINESKWSFISGGNDSTYFSFFGHQINTNDTIILDKWNYNKSTHESSISHFDSTLRDFQNFHPAFQNSINNVYLGNSGLAVKSNLYFEPQPETDFIFANAFNVYNFQSDNAEYFNVSKAFTKFDANIGPNDEQDIDVIHTQNVNPYINGFIRFKNFTSKGDYIYQETRNNSGIIGGSWTQGPFATHLNVTFSNINAQENGGVVDPFFITDTTINTNQVSTRLNNASNYIKDRQIFFDQKIGFFKTNVPDSAEIGDYWFSFQYNFHQHKSLKVYEDVPYDYINPVSLDTLSFYANTYNGTSSFDSVHFFSRKHLFRLNLEEVPYSYPFVGAYFGLGIESNSYSYFNVDTLFNNSQSNKKRNIYLEGGIYRLRGQKFKFGGNYIFYIDGYKQTDFKLDGFLSQKFGNDSNYFELKGKGGIYLETPDYFYTNYKSNHYRWQGEFNSVKRSLIDASITYPKFNLIAGSRFSTLTDYVYLNDEAIPVQEKETFAVLNAYLKNRIEVYRFGLKTEVQYQQSGNENVLPLPLLSGYAALYWFPNVYFAGTEGHMRFNIGADIYYWTKFYAPAYSPALAQFHVQKQQQVGDYPFVGAFVNFEIKRLRFYLRAEHINYDLIGSNYFMGPGYPTPRLVVRYGIAWTFYD